MNRTLAVVAVVTITAVVVAIAAISVTLLARNSPRDGHPQWAPGQFPMPRRLEGLLTRDECRHLIGLAQQSNLQESQVYDADSSRVSRRDRQSEQVWLGARTDPVLERLSQLAARLSGKPTENQEDVQVVRYSPGGFYNAHYDACEGDDEHCRSFVSRGGQRYATLLVYLSDDFSGGGTDFPKINYTAAPKEGDAIFFHSTDETGKLFKDSQHGGQPVEAGNKWIANIWVRHAKYRNAPTPTT
jgi:prolyl 4-hydroxylase